MAKKKEVYSFFKEDKEKDWDNSDAVKIHDHCPYRKVVAILSQVRDYLMALARRTEGEYIAWLIGEVKENTIIIADVYVPEQKASYGSAEPTEKPTRISGIVGTVHKHPDSISSFSGTDERESIPNSLVSLLICKEQFTDCRVTEKMPCGTVLTYPAEVIVVPGSNCEERLANDLQKIKQATYSFYDYDSYYGRLYGGENKEEKDKDKSAIQEQYDYY